MDEALNLPAQLGAYQMKRLVGRGGMGEVFLAWDERLHRRVAIKRVRRDKVDRDRRARFRREAQAVARLSHPAIVQIFDLLTVEGDDCIVMEYVEGDGLDRLLAKGVLEVAEALHLGADVAEGLAEAHGKGLVHRDLKAANVRISRAIGHDGRRRAKVLDFGLALERKSDHQPQGELATADIAGTAYAMSPEQALGRPIDHRSDLFALGGLLHHMLSGRPPFAGEDFQQTLEQVLSREPAPLSSVQPAVPSAASELVERLLAKRPAHRPNDARRVAPAG